MSNPITYPALWFTSGSPINVGQRECAYERWLSYHAGRHGTGWRRRATAIPLATGKGVHDGARLMGEWLLEFQQAHPGQRLMAVPDEVIAWAATEAAERYAHRARTRGLELTKTDLDAAAAVEQMILEQRTLIEGLIWIYGLARLPVLLSLGRLIDVEKEEGPVVDCTCGLGDWVGQWTDHLPRGCTGIVAQGKGDSIWELFDGGALVYEEIKTKSTPNYGWEQQWEHSGQLWLNMEAASHRLGKAVTQAYVPVLYKGKRDRVDRDDKASPRIQMSPLVYGWFDPGAPPMREAEWASRFRWADDWGKWHTLPRTYRRTPIWDANVPLGERADLRLEASRVERWIKNWIPPGMYPEILQVLGPFPKPATLTAEAQQALVAGERRWRADVDWLRKAGIYQAGDRAVIKQQSEDGGDIVYTAADIIPRSWACTKFAGDKCQFFRVCHKEPGWEQIEAIGEYEIRTPHHSSEKEAMTELVTSLGLEWTDEDEDDDGGAE